MERETAEEKFCVAVDLIEQLGLPVNLQKLSPPDSRVTCLGIVIDISNNTLSIDPEKIKDIRLHCISCLGKSFLSKRAFQSLLGKLFYINKCVRPARFFMNRMLNLFRAKSHKRRIKLTAEFYHDLAWFIDFVTQFNGVILIEKPFLDSSETIFLDACLEGIGAVWENYCYASPIPLFSDFILHITHLEMVNLVVALRVWGQMWCHKRVILRCDNLAVVHVVKSGRTRDVYLASCARVIWWLCAAQDIQLDIIHVKGLENTVADTLSRMSSRSPVNLELISHLKDTKTWFKVYPSHFSLKLEF